MTLQKYSLSKYSLDSHSFEIFISECKESVTIYALFFEEWKVSSDFVLFTKFMNRWRKGGRGLPTNTPTQLRHYFNRKPARMRDRGEGEVETNCIGWFDIILNELLTSCRKLR